MFSVVYTTVITPNRMLIGLGKKFRMLSMNTNLNIINNNKPINFNIINLYVNDTDILLVKTFLGLI